jgi:hypothetical protein
VRRLEEGRSVRRRRLGHYRSGIPWRKPKTYLYLLHD